MSQTTLPWIYLLLAGITEVAWAGTMKMTEGYTRPGPVVLNLALMVTSVFLLSQATKSLPLGTSYAIWTGIGAVGATLIGIYYYGESASALRLLCLFLIVAGIIGLKFTHS
ncbi:MAG: multidrug efflux SMR transporter [Blastochloris sp.]|nr:multidrug efflux SMR transporter [Blastochloris sp.]NJO83771.1 multidrug efflux SMR transporter [Blastochloris sp.]